MNNKLSSKKNTINLAEVLSILKNIGKYIQMLWIVFSRPEKWSVFRVRLFEEIQRIGINSIFIVGVMSVFMGAVIALQTASNMDSPLLPEYTIGYINQIEYHFRVLTNDYVVDFSR